MKKLLFIAFILAALFGTLINAMPIPDPFHQITHLQKRCHHYQSPSNSIGDRAAASASSESAAAVAAAKKEAAEKAAAEKKAAEKAAAEKAAAEKEAAEKAAAEKAAAEKEAAEKAAAKKAAAEKAAAEKEAAEKAAAEKAAAEKEAAEKAAAKKAAAEKEAAEKEAAEKAAAKKAAAEKAAAEKAAAEKKAAEKEAAEKEAAEKSHSGGGAKFSGDGTFYNTGLGSCGITNTDDDFIAALNSAQMNNGPNPNNNPICGRKVRINGPKGSVTVAITDTCPTCAFGDIDLSPAAFAEIADFAAGRVPIDWVWIN
ncbi:RlpA-like double-psi beta-barrel-protein domain-containing protein-containing protein [Dichotomocladium elegans]|nr:RlpA-like double-psi beta-barrel-protein domain-containing protein-containing protein [Dichotomocladium elegans]